MSPRCGLTGFCAACTLATCGLRTMGSGARLTVSANHPQSFLYGAMTSADSTTERSKGGWSMPAASPFW